jgi:hypothetical protein
VTRERANAVYDILVRLGGASNGTYTRESFVHAHLGTQRVECQEWRFQGKLGFGGKYWSARNKVDCYYEDETPAYRKLIDQINAELAKIDDLHGIDEKG